METLLGEPHTELLGFPKGKIADCWSFAVNDTSKHNLNLKLSVHKLNSND